MVSLLLVRDACACHSGAGGLCLFSTPRELVLQGSNSMQQGWDRLCHRQAWPLTRGLLRAGQQGPGKLGPDRGSEEAGREAAAGCGEGRGCPRQSQRGSGEPAKCRFPGPEPKHAGPRCSEGRDQGPVSTGMLPDTSPCHRKRSFHVWQQQYGAAIGSCSVSCTGVHTSALRAALYRCCIGSAGNAIFYLCNLRA